MLFSQPSSKFALLLVCFIFTSFSITSAQNSHTSKVWSKQEVKQFSSNQLSTIQITEFNKESVLNHLKALFVAQGNIQFDAEASIEAKIATLLARRLSPNEWLTVSNAFSTNRMNGSSPVRCTELNNASLWEHCDLCN